MNDGGPAFPQNGGIAQLESPMNVQGMTLRDYFAAKAMQAYSSDEAWRADMDPTQTAEAAYRLADAMLEARQS